MKNLVIVLLLGLFLPILVYGQNDLIIEPFATSGKFLDEAIRGDTTATGQRVNLARVYVLRRGGLYFAKNSIQNTGWPLRVKAENGTGKRPVINASRNAPTTYPAQIFQVDTLLELKNLCINGWDEGGEAFAIYLTRIINVNRIGQTVLIDSCILNGSTATLIQTSVAARYMRVTNTTFANCGNVRANNLGNGRGIDFRSVSIDSAFVQNCTFVNVNDRFIRHYGSGQTPIHDLTIDHCTIVNDLAEHGCLALGRVDGKITITNNLFVDNYVFGNDSTAIERLGEFGDTGERGLSGAYRMTFVGTVPTDTVSIRWTVRNNYYSVSPSVQAFYDSRNGLPDQGIGNLIPLTWHINKKLGADSVNAFTKLATPITFTNAPVTPIAMAQWFFKPIAEGGSGKVKQNATFKPEYDFDRREMGYFVDTLNLRYQTSSPAYTGASGGQPVGDLRWWGMIPVGVEEAEQLVPGKYELSVNYPNPFNPTTKIRFALPQAGNVTLKVFNVLGQEIATLTSGRVQAGTHEYIFDARDLSSGVYIYTVSSGGFIASKKMLLVK